MNNTRLFSNDQFVSGVRELVKGHEQELLNEMRPIVRRQSVWLDLSRTERIDAAGLAALVLLYCEARKGGHDFAVVNPRSRVARVLAIVGLDRLIVPATSGETRPQNAPLSLELVA
jgi:anti-anti-sigma factor